MNEKLPGAGIRATRLFIMKKLLAIIPIVLLLFSYPAYATTTLKWNVFDAQYQSAAFSFVTEPIVVNSSDVRKMSYTTLPLCDSLKARNVPEFDCIKKLEVSSDGAKWIEGKFISYLPIRQVPIDSPPGLTAEWAFSDIDIQAKYLANNVDGARSSIWSFPEISHLHGDQFLFSYQIGTPVYNDKLNYVESSTEIEIQPITSSTTGSVPSTAGNSRLSNSWVDSLQCFYESRGSYCLQFYPFDNSNLRFRISLNMKEVLGSLSSEAWLFAHALDPVITQNTIEGESTSQQVTIEASPVSIEVPTIQLESETQIIDYVDSVYPPLPPNAREQLVLAYEATKNSALQRYLQGLNNNGSYMVTEIQNAFSLGATYLMGRQDKFIVPENTRQETGLRIKSLPVGSVGASQELFQILQLCPKTPFIAGLISSNATAVETTPPTYDSSTQTLTYRVAAPHLGSKSQVNFGFYRLQLNPQVAQCIWGSDLLGAKAEASIVSDNGEIQTTTTVFSYTKNSAIFDVSGFHYSSGSIKIKVTPEKMVNPIPTASNNSKPQTLKKSKVIVCKKGKIIKRVSGMKPKCPSGFKKS